MPSPAITALLDGFVCCSWPCRSWDERRRSPNNCSIRPLVPDPGSRVRKVSSASAASGRLGFSSRRCPVGAMMNMG